LQTLQTGRKRGSGLLQTGRKRGSGLLQTGRKRGSGLPRNRTLNKKFYSLSSYFKLLVCCQVAENVKLSVCVVNIVLH